MGNHTEVYTENWGDVNGKISEFPEFLSEVKAELEIIEAMGFNSL